MCNYFWEQRRFLVCLCPFFKYRLGTSVLQHTHHTYIHALTHWDYKLRFLLKLDRVTKLTFFTHDSVHILFQFVRDFKLRAAYNCNKRMGLQWLQVFETVCGTKFNTNWSWLFCKLWCVRDRNHSVSNIG